MFERLFKGLRIWLEDFIFQFPLPKDKDSFELVIQMQCPDKMVNDILSERLFGIIEIYGDERTSNEIWFDGKEIVILTMDKYGQFNIYCRRTRYVYDGSTGVTLFRTLRRVNSAKMLEELSYFWLTKAKHYSSV